MRLFAKMTNVMYLKASFCTLPTVIFGIKVEKREKTTRMFVYKLAKPLHICLFLCLATEMSFSYWKWALCVILFPDGNFIMFASIDQISQILM